ncbi:MAG TPA: beta-propeller fold lactonase family protein [Kineosporiaceae bacterium]|nr:beta-propeller fold lactonase family protein [Kineosporiaceae bacterium]
MAAGVVLVALLQWGATDAAFTQATTSSVSLTAGTVSISDDTPGGVLLSAGDLLPGGVLTQCVDVTYTGSAPSQVRLYATGATGALGRELDLRVELGAGGDHTACTGFVPATTVYWGSVADLVTTRTDWASGLAAFDPGPGPVHRTYRFTFTLRPDVPASAQGAVAAATYRWEARSRLPVGGLGTVALPGGCANSGGGNGCTAAGALAQTWDVAVSPDGRNVYAASGDYASSLVTLVRDPSTGGLSPLGGVAGCLTHAVVAGCTQVRGLDYAHAVVVSPDGRNVYVTSELDDTLGVYARDPSTGALTQLAGTQGCIRDNGTGGCAPDAQVHFPRELAVSPDGRNVYLTNNSSQLMIFDRDPRTGALTADGCLTAGANGPCTEEDRLYPLTGLTVSPDGATVYTSSLLALARDPLTGALTPLAGTAGCVKASATAGCAVDAALSDPARQVRVTPDGTQLLVASDGPGSVLVFARDVATGAIGGRQQCFATVAGNGCTAVPVLQGAWTAVPSRDGTAVYVAMASPGHGVLAFDRDVTTGALTPHPGPGGCLTHDGNGGACAAVTTLYQDRDLAESPDGRHLYVGSFASYGVAALTR